MPNRQQAELVNPVPVDEVAAWVAAMATTFLTDRGSARVQGMVDQLTRRWDPGRAWGVRDRGDWVATLRTEPRSLTVPAASEGREEVSVDAVTNVTVAATHRRQGLMSRMLNASLRDAQARGEVLSVLIAAEWPIYGRFGYAPATVSSEYVLQRSRPGARCKGDMSGIRAVEVEEAASVAAEVFNRARWRWAGQMDRDEGWWQRTLGLEGNVPRTPPAPNWLIHEGEDGVDGILGWSPEGEPSLMAPAQRAVVSALFAATDAAYRNLWSYLTALDGIDQVRLAGRPTHEPVRWLLEDARALITTRQVDFLWLRLLDVPAALRARRYAVPGDLVLDVVDQDEPAMVAGRYRLIVDGEGRAQCESTQDEPDLEITQRRLASIYLGGCRLAEMRLAGGARELLSGALDRLDLMFSRPLPPWNATWF
jgi:predicted acetyltransferase